MQKKINGNRIGRESVRNLVIRLDQFIAEWGAWLQQNPTLLRELYKFRTNAVSLLTQRVSLSDSLHIQNELNKLFLSLDFLGPTDYLGRRSFLSIRNPERDLMKDLKEWGEALKAAYDYNVRWDMMVEIRYFTKQKILEEAGFSEKEREQLGWKKILGAKNTLELEIPQRTMRENRLSILGYNSAYTRGIDEMNGELLDSN